MPHPIIEIIELTQLVADHLLLDSRQGLVSLACTCRALEEQALSTLWSEQSSPETLIQSTLPPGILSSPRFPPQPTRAEWDRFRRYASWMHHLNFDSRFPELEEVLHMISSNLPNGLLFPGLRDLIWAFQPHILPFYRLFLSPRLTYLSLSYFPLSAAGERDEVISSIASVILELDTFPLRSFRLNCPPPIQANRSLKSAASSAVLRCGPSLESLAVRMILSDAAVRHIMQLPNLTAWRPMDGPPKAPDLSPCDAFPKLKTLWLESEVSLQWLPFFAATARRIPSGESSNMPSNRGPISRLTTLTAWPEVPVDTTFISPIMQFRMLVKLALRSSCSSMGDECTFSLTDGDIEEIATALPRLNDASFGRICPANSCRTTVSSLVSFSTHCQNLARLEIHFSTTNLCDDLEFVSADPRLDKLPSLPGRAPFVLLLSDVPISISKEDIRPVVTGFRRIFPSLEEIRGNRNSPALEELNARLVYED